MLQNEICVYLNKYMYTHTFKHIDSSADSTEAITWFQTSLKQLSALDGF